jgi:hypothetical protein
MPPFFVMMEGKKLLPGDRYLLGLTVPLVDGVAKPLVLIHGKGIDVLDHALEVRQAALILADKNNLMDAGGQDIEVRP